MKTAIHGCFEGGRVEVFKIGKVSSPRYGRPVALDSDTLSREGSLASEANLDMVLNAVRQYGPKFVIIDEVHNGLLLRISCTLLKLTQDRPPNSLEICLTTHCEESKQLYYS